MKDEQLSLDETKAVWSPKALIWLAIFFSVFPSALMFAYNYGLYGYPKRRIFWTVLTLLVLVIFIALDFVDPEGATLRFIGLTLTTSWILYLKQINLYNKWKANGGRTASPWKGIGICIGFTAAYITLFLAFSYLYPYDYSACNYIERENWQKAEVVLLQSRRDYPDDLNVRYNLAIVYASTDRIQEATAELQSIIEANPNYEGAQEFFNDLKQEPSP